jgi:hypothetical protein
MNNKYIIILTLALILIFGCQNKKIIDEEKKDKFPIYLKKDDLNWGQHHKKHYEVFGKYSSGYNLQILKGIDIVQSSAMDGGGYFTGIKAEPPESPIGYNLQLMKKVLVDLERKTSYCSGASYSAFIEGLNLIYNDGSKVLDENRYEALRMQELDGSRREDGVKYWGKWNDDGYGNHFALVQYSDMGKIIEPKDAMPGDFMNISWKSGVGHSVVFLGWFNDEGKLHVVYWSSQKSTNGLGDAVVPIDKIKEVMIVRLTNPDNLFSFDVDKTIDRNVKGFEIKLDE